MSIAINYENRMKLVIVESPYWNENESIREFNKQYAFACLKDCLLKGEAPFASHLLYTNFLNDAIDEERWFGINSGLEWGRVAEQTVVYQNLGISSGMKYGIENAMKNNRPVVYRYLPSNLWEELIKKHGSLRH